VPVRGGKEVLIMVCLLCQKSKTDMQVVAYMFLVVQCSVLCSEQMVCEPRDDSVVALTCYCGADLFILEMRNGLDGVG
jgi:hypothetical protein